MTLQEEITEALVAHQVERGHRDMAMHCDCGWTSRGNDLRPIAHSAHQSAILIPIIESHTREAARQALVEFRQGVLAEIEENDPSLTRQTALRLMSVRLMNAARRYRAGEAS